MSDWKVRHEGSPTTVTVTLHQLTEGLVEGQWETTDEVMGVGDTKWVPIEQHPKLAELVEELEPPMTTHHDEETHLDMNALIDVCLVLLVFFILTASVAAIQKVLQAPTADSDKPGVPVVTKEQVDKTMIHVKAKMEGGEPVIYVEDRKVEPHRLVAELRKRAASASKSILLLEHDDDVPQEIVVKIIDSASGAGMTRVSLLVP